jgi:AraC-like DNA-binding protein
MTLSQAERYAAIHVDRLTAGGFAAETGFAAARRASMIRIPHEGETFGDAPSDVVLITSVLRGTPFVDCTYDGYRLQERMYPGDLLFQPLQKGCVGHADEKATIQIMAFDGPWFRALAVERSRPLDLDAFAARTWRDPLVSGLLERMWRAMRTDAAAGQAWIDAAALTIFGIVGAEKETPPSPRSRPLGPQQMQRVHDFIAAHLGEPIGLTEMAAVAGLSVWQFARSFEAARRQTPHRFLMMMRLQRARELLEDSDLPLGAIAYLCGFSSQAHFTTRFREQMSLPPGAFRRRTTSSR